MPSAWTSLHYHVVFGTRLRQVLISREVQEPLYAYIGGVVRGEGGTLLAAGGMADHIHLVIRLKADVALADLVRKVKSNSSRWINERSTSTPMNFSWQAGYGGFTISRSQLDRVIEYVRSQEEHHRIVSFQEEYLAFLRRHDLDTGVSDLVG